MNKKPVPEGFKRCHGKCKRTLPATNEYFHGKKALCNECKDCAHVRYLEKSDTRKANQREWWAEHKDEENAKKRANNAYYCELAKNWRLRNLDHANEMARIRYKKDPKKVLERNKKSKERHIVTYKEYQREYRTTHKGISRNSQNVNKHKRRAIENGLGVDFTTQNWLNCLQYWGNKCAICGQSANMWITIASDHWIALTDKRHDNPGTVKWNMIPLCHAKKGIPAGVSCCNNSKSRRDPVEWLIERLGKHKAKRKIAEIESYLESVKSK